MCNRKNDLKSTDTLILDLEESWFMKTKYVPQSKYQSLKKKYSEKIMKEVSDKNFDEKIIIIYLERLLNNNKNNELINDLENAKEKNSFAIKIQDSVQGLNWSLLLNFKKNKQGKLKLVARSKSNSLEGLEKIKQEMIAYIKREIFFDIMAQLK